MANLEDSQKLEYEILLEEYKRLNSEISSRVGYLDKDINYHFILLGIIGTGTTAILNIKDISTVKAMLSLEYILLFFPIIFTLLGFYYALNSIYIFKIAQYIHFQIRPKMAEIIGIDQNEILGYEFYIQKLIFNDKSTSARIITFIGMQWTITIPLLLLGFFCILKFEDSNNAFLLNQKFLFALNLIFIAICFSINRKQYQDLKDQQ